MCILATVHRKFYDIYIFFFMFVVGYCWEQKPRDKLYFHVYLHMCMRFPLIPMAQWAPPSSGPGLPHCRGFTIAPRHTTFNMTPLGEWSDRRRDLYLTASDTHKRQTSMPPAEFEPAILASERPQTNTLDRKASEIVYMYRCVYAHTHTHTHTHIYIYIYIYIYIHTYIHT